MARPPLCRAGPAAGQMPPSRSGQSRQPRPAHAPARRLPCRCRPRESRRLHPLRTQELTIQAIIMLDAPCSMAATAAAFYRRARHELAATLAAAPTVPTVIAMHHPPFDTGIDWMDLGDREWVAAGGRAGRPDAGRPAIPTGHIHRAVATGFCRRGRHHQRLQRPGSRPATHPHRPRNGRPAHHHRRRSPRLRPPPLETAPPRQPPPSPPPKPNRWPASDENLQPMRGQHRELLKAI